MNRQTPARQMEQRLTAMRTIEFSEFTDVWLLLVSPLVISIIFYLSSRDELPTRRLLCSIHGFLIAVALLYAIVAGAFTWDPTLPDRVVAGITLPFNLCLFGALASMVASLVLFRGSRAVLLLHVITLVLAFTVWLVGGTQISHISL